MSPGDSLHNDNFRTSSRTPRLCHPPFGDRNWGQEKLVLDPRWKYGTPPRAEPELAWAQHALQPTSPALAAAPYWSCRRQWPDQAVWPPDSCGRCSGAVRSRQSSRLGPGAIYPRHVGPHLWVLEQPPMPHPNHGCLLVDSAGQETILSVWRSFSARDATVGGPESGAWRSVAAIDLLDESVDLTPSRHVGIRAAESFPPKRPRRLMPHKPGYGAP